MPLRVKRIYEPRGDDDGHRFLVDRLWPRGMSKADAEIDEWLRDLAPSTELRRWFAHDHDKWPELLKRYAAELDEQPELVDRILALSAKDTVTLLFAARDEQYNNAVALQSILEGNA